MLKVADYKNLFVDVQTSGIFDDSKTFPDMVANGDILEVLSEYNRIRNDVSFSLKKFVNENFTTVLKSTEDYISDRTLAPEEHIERLWPILTRSATNSSNLSTYINLPNPFVVPGGRFQEVYYWDSYFTILGLLKSGLVDLVESMLDNFAYLIDNFGFIPNGNRSYFLSRSQPPFFALMVTAFKSHSSEKANKYVPQLLKEYNFWMNPANGRLVKLDEDIFLNRYFDNDPSPRPESYIEDVELAEHFSGNKEDLYRNIRAACESGWDFSSRWLTNPHDLSSIITTEIVPVDLNCLIYNLEKTIADLTSDSSLSITFNEFAEKRKKALLNVFWNDNQGFFCDYNLSNKSRRDNLTLAGTFPLFFGISNQEQANSVAVLIKDKFLKKGGLITTTEETEQQWDAPNGWAPLQYMAIKGLERYGFQDLAKQIREKWIALNTKVFTNTGKFTEKYNVQSDAETGGGEYPNQDGFGWTNGVFLALK